MGRATKRLDGLDQPAELEVAVAEREQDAVAVVDGGRPGGQATEFSRSGRIVGERVEHVADALGVGRAGGDRRADGEPVRGVAQIAACVRHLAKTAHERRIAWIRLEQCRQLLDGLRPVAPTLGQRRPRLVGLSARLG